MTKKLEILKDIDSLATEMAITDRDDDQEMLLNAIMVWENRIQLIRKKIVDLDCE